MVYDSNANEMLFVFAPENEIVNDATIAVKRIGFSRYPY